MRVRCPDRNDPDGGCHRGHELVVIVGNFDGERFGSSRALGRLVAHWTHGTRDAGALRVASKARP